MSKPSNNISREEVRLKVLRAIEHQPATSQRELADSLNVSLGGINYCVKALIEKGCIKVESFSRSNKKLRYAYLLTPKGMKEKSSLTTRFLSHKLQEYERLKKEISILERELEQGEAG
jgi:EPS-associated MarR family transcriptional regulator